MNRCHPFLTGLLCLSMIFHTYSTSNSLFAADPIYVDLNASGSNSGLNWSNAYTDLQSALAHARSDNSVTQIWVAQGTYVPTSGTDRTISFELVEGVQLIGGFEGGELLLEDRDIIANPCILSGNIGSATEQDDNSYHVVRATDLPGDDVSIDGFTITLGNADGTLRDQYGGGLLIEASGNGVISLPNIINCIFKTNAAAYGGAIAQYADAEGSITSIVSFSTFENNFSSVQGGALYHYKGNASHLITDYRACIFSGNNSVRGGVLYSNGNNGATVDNVTSWNAGFFNSVFFDNQANFGGVFYLSDTGSATHLLARNCTMYNNVGLNNSDVLLLNLTSSANIGNCIIIECDDPFDDFNFLPNQLNVQNSIVDYGLGAGTYLDPEFVDAVNRDFRLEACSPVIDAGINFGTPANFDPLGNPRQYGTLVDIGAYEFVGTSITLPIPEGAAVSDAALEEFLDVDGWTHYYNCTSDQLLLSIFKDNQDIGTVGQDGFNVSVATTGDYGTTGTDLSSADYLTSAGDWMVMNRFWEVNNAKSFANPVKVRFYFSDQDYTDVQDAVANVGGFIADPRDLTFFKVSGNGIAPLANDVIAQGGSYTEFTYADSSSTLTWTNGMFNGQRYAEFEVDAFSGGGGGYLNQVALPVDLSQFYGVEEKKMIRLNWETTLEDNSDYFIVEKSADAKQFYPLSSHQAQGFTTTLTKYTTLDESPYLGANYYRLKQVDRDGEYVYSDVITVFINNDKDQPLLFPNPTFGNLTLQLPESLEGEIRLQVWDGLRRVVWERELDQASGYLIPLTLNSLEPGLYVLKVKAKRYQSYSPFVITNQF